MENELKTNASKATAEEQYLLRKQIAKLKKQGKTTSEVVEILDVSERYVQSTWKKYSEGGIAAIKIKKRGRKKGEKRTLTPGQEQEIQRLLVDKYPEQLKLKGCLWTRQNVRELIKRKYKIEIPVRTLSEYFQRWGFSVQRPKKRAYKQNPEHIQKWIEEEYPAIKNRAKTENAEIYWGDETGIQNTSNYARGYAPIGQTPILEIETHRFKVNMLAAINNQGKLRFMLYRDNMNQQKFLEFLKRLVKDSCRKIFFIVDNLKVHHGKIVAKWLDKHKSQIEVFFLPPYAPEYNPDEYLNNNLKQNLGNRSLAHSADDIETQTRSFMKKLQLDRSHVRQFFKQKNVSYAL